MIQRLAGPSSAFILRQGVVTDLGSFGVGYAEAYAMNNFDVVVGICLTTAGESHAFRWEDGQMTDLGTLPGGQFSLAFDVNDAGQAVGVASGSFPGGSSSRAVFWGGDMAMDLNDLIAPGSGWVLRGATAINNQGQIVGVGTYNGRDAAFMLNPVGSTFVPEPMAGGVVAFGLAGRLGRRPRRRS